MIWPYDYMLAEFRVSVCESYQSFAPLWTCFWGDSRCSSENWTHHLSILRTVGICHGNSCTSKSPWSMNIEESTIQSNAVAHSVVDLLLLCPYSKGYRTFPFELSLLRYQRVLWQHPLWQSTFQNLSSAGCHFCHCVVLFWARSWSPGHVRFYLISITNGRNNWWTDAVERVWATR